MTAASPSTSCGNASNGVYSARTYAELERFTRDLPASGSAPTPATAPASRSHPRIGGTARHSFSVAIMSGATRRGAWVVPPDYTAAALMGGIQLDLRDARFSQREVTIRAFALMGGIEIIVPDDINVIVNGVGIMGGFDDNANHAEASPGQPVLRVTGVAFWGGVEVKRKRRKTDQRPAIDSE